MAFDYNGTIYYANMTTNDVTMNSNTTHKLHIGNDTVLYCVYDNSETAPEYDIGFSQCIDPATNGTAHGFRNDSRGDYGAWSYNTDLYGLTTDQTWGVTFEGYGNVKGIASCNGTPGTKRGESTTANFSQSDTGQYCWCKMTEPAVSRWVFFDFYFLASQCASGCASYCSERVQDFADFRLAVFGSVGQN